MMDRIEKEIARTRKNIAETEERVRLATAHIEASRAKLKVLEKAKADATAMLERALGASETTAPVKRQAKPAPAATAESAEIPEWLKAKQAERAQL